MRSEDIIASLRERSIEHPICWLVCYGERALQAVPPNGEGPHLIVFRTNAKADRFIEGRKKYYQEEPLSVVGIEAIETVHELALATSEDPNYEAPPCGLVLDFDYETAGSKGTLSPGQVATLQPGQIKDRLGLGMEPEPVTAGSGQAAPEKKMKPKHLLLGCSIAGLAALFCISIGTVLWVTTNRIPALANPEETNTPLPTSSSPVPAKALPTPSLPVPPTALPTPTAEAQGLAYTPTGEEVLQDAFDSNKNHWISYYPGRVASVSDGHLRVVSYERGYVNVGTCNGCGAFSDDFYFEADLVLNQFEPVFYGLAFCITENNNYYIYSISHNSFKYTLIKLIDDEWVTLIDETLSEEIKGHPNPNKLGVSFEKGTIKLFINGVMVDSYSDSQPLTNGEIGLVIHDAGAELYGDNIFAYQR